MVRTARTPARMMMRCRVFIQFKRNKKWAGHNPAQETQFFTKRECVFLPDASPGTSQGGLGICRAVLLVRKEYPAL
jgi:hypothetical protein